MLITAGGLSLIFCPRDVALLGVYGRNDSLCNHIFHWPRFIFLDYPPLLYSLPCVIEGGTSTLCVWREICPGFP